MHAEEDNTDILQKIFDNSEDSLVVFNKGISSKLKKLSKKDIKEQCPDISISTIESTLHDLLNNRYIIKIGSGKNTSYIRNSSN